MSERKACNDKNHRLYQSNNGGKVVVGGLLIYFYNSFKILSAIFLLWKWTVAMPSRRPILQLIITGDSTSRAFRRIFGRASFDSRGLDTRSMQCHSTLTTTPNRSRRET
eukprot:scaffold6433_cov125-Cylindrotheca_fusiformis.AAC.17